MRRVIALAFVLNFAPGVAWAADACLVLNPFGIVLNLDVLAVGSGFLLSGGDALRPDRLVYGTARIFPDGPRLAFTVADGTATRHISARLDGQTLTGPFIASDGVQGTIEPVPCGTRPIDDTGPFERR